MLVRTHKYLNLHTNIKTEHLNPLSNLVSGMMRMPVQPNKAIVGKNAFAHSSGIHQDGVLKNRENYEIIDPAEVGAGASSIVLTARSGRAALNYRLVNLGYQLDRAELDLAYDAFLVMADEHKNIDDAKLHVLMSKVGVPVGV
jgi:2-isopropylmalate synthase